jgi:hypothetical protein
MIYLSKSKKENLILNTGDLSQSKVKSFLEKENNTNQKTVARGKDIIQNKL